MKLNHSIIIAILLTISPAISLAERDAKAQYNLGVMYDKGYGIGRNIGSYGWT
jgi:TPR repeat protein